MQTKDQVDVIIYRVRDNGLEVFLVNPNANNSNEADNWQAPIADENASGRILHCIELDPVSTPTGDRKAIAIEADWHEIPSLRALIYEDYRVAKEKAKMHFKSMLPDLDKGTFFAVKEAVKRVMPEQYAFLKELKEIVLDKNQTKYI
jgi:predicted NUDIX family NTP pyrophosphohydrolase